MYAPVAQPENALCVVPANEKFPLTLNTEVAVLRFNFAATSPKLIELQTAFALSTVMIFPAAIKTLSNADGTELLLHVAGLLQLPEDTEAICSESEAK